MPINYASAAEELTQPSNSDITWWTPQPGQYKVTFLEDFEPYTVTMQDGSTSERIRARIKVDGKEYMWGMRKAKTVNSLYGQIVELGKAWGSLKDTTVTVIVTFRNIQGRQARIWTIVEAQAVIAKMQQSQAENQPAGSQ